jgi:hypothetical protein
MPKPDSELNKLRSKLKQGCLYRYENEIELSIWNSSKSVKFAKKLKPGQIVLFVKIQRATAVSSQYRVYLIRGEDIGYVLMKNYEAATCFKSLDTGSDER